MKKQVVLTGDRPSGKLHLGHFVGSLQNRLKMQDDFDQFIMIADMQALTDNFATPEKISQNLLEVMLDYLAIGLLPEKNTFFIQSQISAISELTQIYLNLVTLARLQRNPTIKEEIKAKNFNNNIPVGFLSYPVNQAADITCVQAEVVPVGEDQLPIIEQSNEIVDKFNNLYGQTLPRIKAVVPKSGGRLPGIDGQQKMSKSLDNAIYLSDEPELLKQKVMKMFTDPNHLKISDPGKIEGNTVFLYLDIFCKDQTAVEAMKKQYQAGGLGDVTVKKFLIDTLEEFLTPIRTRRKYFSEQKEFVWNILKQGCTKTNVIANQTLTKVKKAIGIDYF